MLLLLLACAGDPGDDAAKTDDLAPPLDSTPVEDTDIQDCGLLGGIALSEESRPGRTVQAAAILGATDEELELRWTVDAGTLDVDTGPEVVWTLPTDVAEHVAQEVGITLTASAEGCITEIMSAPVRVDWPEAERVVVLYRAGSDESRAVADHYATIRGVPAAHLCAVESADTTTLSGAEWPGFVQAVQACIDAVGPHVMYVVPVWGVPYKVADRVLDVSGSGAFATVSADALLAYGIDAEAADTAIYNPLYQEGDSATGTYAPYVPFGELRRSLRTWDHLYLVTRIDGADAAAAMALVDRTATAADLAARGELAGVVYVDGRFGDTPPATDEFGTYESGEWNMWGTRAVFEADGRYPVVWDGNDAEFGTAPAPTACPDALYFAGWYNYGGYNDAFTWAPGAIGGHLDSCSACDIRAGGNWSAVALQRGITATFGAVNEPYVAGMPEYDQLFLYLLQGASYAEAAYESTVVGRWMMVWVGDPLYRPYPGG